MKFKFAAVLAASAVLCTGALAACGTEESGYSMTEAFILMEDLGYDGRLIDFIGALPDGEDTKIENITLNEEGEIVVTGADGSVLFLYKVPAADDGDDGTDAGESAAQQFKYTISPDGKYYTVTGLNSMLQNNLTLPAEYNGLPVKGLGDEALKYNLSLTGLTLPDCITHIGYYAFGDDSNLKSFIIPEDIEYIGDGAFNNCASLEYTEHGGALYLGSRTQPYKVLIKVTDTNIWSFAVPEGTKIIYDSAFRGCTSLTNVSLPEGLTQIGSSAFDGCSSLSAISIPSTVKYICSSAFDECSSLTAVTIPEGVTTLDGYAFARTSLMTVSLPRSITKIDSSAFYDVKTLSVVYYAGSEEEWKQIDEADRCEQLERAQIIYMAG